MEAEAELVGVKVKRPGLEEEIDSLQDDEELDREMDELRDSLSGASSEGEK